MENENNDIFSVEYINSLEAGPELDSLVAEKIMLYTPMRNKRSGVFWSAKKHRTQLIFGSELHQARINMGIKDDKPGDGFVFAPSWDIKDAFEVVEKLAGINNEEKDFMPFILNNLGEKKWLEGFIGVWSASFSKRLGKIEAIGSTPQEAISKASLMTKIGEM